MVRAKTNPAPVVVVSQWDLFGWIWQMIEAIFSIDYLAPFQALFILLCYAYLIYYTGMNLLSRSKYYINLSHNLMKWILLGLVNCSGALLDKLFKFNILSRLTIMTLTGLIVYPSRRMQRLHLSLAIRNKDKLYEKRREDPLASGLSFFQKFLNSTTAMFLGLANLTLKLIHPDNRTPEVESKVTDLYDTVKRKRYYLELAESQVAADLNIDIPGVTVNMTTSGVMVRQPREQSKTPDYMIRDPDSLSPKPIISVPGQPHSFSSLGAQYYQCVEVIQITKKKYEYFRDVKIRYMADTNEVEIFILENNRSDISELEEVRVMNDQTLELVHVQKNRFIQFKNPSEMQTFLRPIIQGSKDQM